MKVIVDLELCEANAVCMACCPEVFEVDDTDELIVRDEAVTEAVRAQIEIAVRRCPRQALELEG
jgi:ferredoxin